MHPICNPINLCPASFVNIPNTDDKRAYAEYRLFAAIQRARRDMLDKPVADLRRMRYTDYSGKVDAWPITSIIGQVGGRSAAGDARPGGPIVTTPGRPIPAPAPGRPAGPAATGPSKGDVHGDVGRPESAVITFPARSC